MRHEPGRCAGCGGGLADAIEVGVERRQVFDLPPITVRVTEHQLVTRRCACGAATCGRPPDGVTAPVQYGPRSTAIILYLYLGQFLSKKRTAQALTELFGTPVSPGTIATMTARAAGRLDRFCDLVRGGIAAAEVAHFDETGFRVDGQLRWVHSASTERFSLITVHDKRGRAAMDATGVLPGFAGAAVHDAWAPYDCYTRATHALCNAHYADLPVMPILSRLARVGGGAWERLVGIIRGLREMRGAGRRAGSVRAGWSAGLFSPARVL